MTPFNIGTFTTINPSTLSCILSYSLLPSTLSFINFYIYILRSLKLIYSISSIYSLSITNSLFKWTNWCNILWVYFIFPISFLILSNIYWLLVCSSITSCSYIMSLTNYVNTSTISWSILLLVYILFLMWSILSRYSLLILSGKSNYWIDPLITSNISNNLHF